MTMDAAAPRQPLAAPIAASVEAINALKAPTAFKLGAKMVLKLRAGSLDVTTPDGRTLVFHGAEPGPAAAMTINDWRFCRRLMMSGVMGVAESYMDGDWDTPDLAAFLAFFSTNMDEMWGELKGRPILRFFNRVFHAFNANTRSGSKRNIYAHYDLGNEFYATWLDPTMTYSAARFARSDQPLHEAQQNKYAALAQSIGLQRGEHVLEIGAGWGGFAEYAAKEREARVTGITISREQFDFASARMQREGLNEKVDIKLVDYRDVDGQYDRVASIEMFEAVGQEYWPQYFQKVRDVLRPGGSAGLQIITIRDDLFDRYSKSVDFIQKYIFPGGMLPSPERLRAETDKAGLEWRDASPFGVDYADTLAQWLDRFDGAWDQIRALSNKFDDRFRRLWRFYLAYCEAGFRTGRIDVAQFTLARPA